MEAIFAMEDLRCVENVWLTEVRSIADPVLMGDGRILSQMLCRQHESCRHGVIDYFGSSVQTELKPHMRKIVSDWMLEVTEEQQCHAEVFHLAVDYLDRFLSVVPVRKTQFQLLGCVCLFLASKFKETCPIPVENLVIYTDHSVSARDITHWELVVLNALNWDLSSVTPFCVLEQLLQLLNHRHHFTDRLHMDRVRKHAETLCALAATEYVFSSQSSAVVATACIGAALRGLHVASLDDMLHTLHTATQAPLDCIRQCMEQIEVSINLSMSGASFQPSCSNSHPDLSSASAAPATAASCQMMPKFMPGASTYFHPSASSASTTPTDLMECSAALNVY